MHKVSISQSIIDRVVARRGREHIFDDLNPAKTALVVVDMQNGFMLPEVGHAPCPMAHEIVPHINRLARRYHGRDYRNQTEPRMRVQIEPLRVGGTEGRDPWDASE